MQTKTSSFSVYFETQIMTLDFRSFMSGSETLDRQVTIRICPILAAQSCIDVDRQALTRTRGQLI